MTAYRFATLTCDGCGAIYDNGRDTRIAQCRASARREGWHSPTWDGNDYCPGCDAERERAR